MKNTSIKTSLLAGTSIATMLFLSAGLSASAAITPITSQLDLGSRGAQVSSLQEFLATNPYIYPEGLITGYYGSLTGGAVSQFQASYNLPAVGRVGPLTMGKINALIASGQGLDITAPSITSLGATAAGGTATISVTTDTAAQAKVFYSTSPIPMSEATTGATAPYVGGAVAAGTGFLTSQNVTIGGLLGNVNYYYVVMVTDMAGNVTISQQGTFHVS